MRIFLLSTYTFSPYGCNGGGKKHSAVNYPVGDYGSFTPVLPTKVYNDSSVPPGTFSVLNLPNVNISLVSKTNQSIN